MRRREFIAGLGATAWQLAAQAQQPTMPIVGFLSSGGELSGGLRSAFFKGLEEIGYVEGRNVAIEYRLARDDLGRLPELAAELASPPQAGRYRSASESSGNTCRPSRNCAHSSDLRFWW
jgi:putative tryptophan/tyrosine transport system substrate-binding protein